MTEASRTAVRKEPAMLKFAAAILVIIPFGAALADQPPRLAMLVPARSAM
jgi:hypothetical protein